MRGGFPAAAIQRERPDVDRLAGLVDGLLGGKQNAVLVLQADLLREVGRADRGLDGVAHRVCAGKTGGELELRFGRAARIEPAAVKRSGLAVGSKEVNAESGGAGDGVVVRIADD